MAFQPRAMAFQPNVAATDFNNDGKPDYLLYNASTHQTALWYLNNNVHIGGASGPTLPAGWQPVGVADFNRDGHPDYLLFNSRHAADSDMVYEQQRSYRRGDHGPTLPGRLERGSGWRTFNGDGHPDYLLFNPRLRAPDGDLVHEQQRSCRQATSGPTIPGRLERGGSSGF